MARGTHVNSLQLRFHQKRAVNRVVFSIFVFISLVLMILERQYPVVPKFIRTTVVDVSLPFLEVLSLPIDGIIYMGTHLEDLSTINEKNSFLRKENERLRARYLEAIQMKAENIELRKLLNIVHHKDPFTISARIVGNVRGAFMDTAIINAGKENHITSYLPVINEKGLVGRVTDVGQRTSRILLLTDINSHIPVITSASRERGVVVGNNATYLTLIYLEEGHKVKLGEVIVTSGDGEYFPSNIPVGRVVEIAGNEARIIPFVNWDKLEFVSIIKLD